MYWEICRGKTEGETLHLYIFEESGKLKTKPLAHLWERGRGEGKLLLLNDPDGEEHCRQKDQPGQTNG